MEQIIIETRRLILRVPTLSDAQEINEAIQPVWPELQRWMGWAHDGENTLEATKNYLCTIVRDQLNKGGLPLLAFCKETGKLVVSTGLTLHDDGIYETGYWVTKDFLGKGYATEASHAVLRYAFDAHGVDAVHITYFQGNEKSRRVIEKLGFTPTGFKFNGHRCCLNGELMDVHEFVMTDPAVLPPLDAKWGRAS